MSPPRESIFSRLVSGVDDIVGALAYVLYKQHKAEYVGRIYALHGRAPTREELDTFQTLSSLATQLEGWRTHAERLSETMIRRAIERQLEQLESSARRTLDRCPLSHPH